MILCPRHSQSGINDAEDGDIISVWGPAPGQPPTPPYVYQENIDFMGKGVTVVNRSFIPGQVPEEPDWDYVAIDGR